MGTSESQALTGSEAKVPTGGSWGHRVRAQLTGRPCPRGQVSNTGLCWALVVQRGQAVTLAQGCSPWKSPRGSLDTKMLSVEETNDLRGREAQIPWGRRDPALNAGEEVQGEAVSSRRAAGGSCDPWAS